MDNPLKATKNLDTPSFTVFLYVIISTLSQIDK